MKQISLMGLPRSGKSCYIYAMAKTMSRGVEGITISSENFDQQLELREQWKTIKNGEWPKGTDKSKEYIFNCRINLSLVMQFSWCDHRGGIHLATDEISNNEREKLYEVFEGSAAVIFCIDAKRILHAINDDDGGESMEEIEATNDIFQELLNRNKLKKIPPIIIAITQSDMLNKDQLDRSKKLLKCVLPLLFQEGNKLDISIVPITLGVGLGKTEQNKIIGNIHIDPKKGNIHIPILFTLYCALDAEFSNTDVLVKTNNQELQKLYNELNRLESLPPIQKWFKSEEIKQLKSKIARLEGKNEDNNDIKQEIENKFAIIRSQFGNDVEIYSDGKQKTF